MAVTDRLSLSYTHICASLSFSSLTVCLPLCLSQTPYKNVDCHFLSFLTISFLPLCLQWVWKEITLFLSIFILKYHFSHNHNWNITSTVVSVHTRYLLLTLLVFLRYPFSVPHSSLQIHQALSIELSASVVCSGLQQFSLGCTVGATQGLFLRPIQHCLYCVV